MNLKDIKVGEEYAVGNPNWGLYRAKVLEVGPYSQQVPTSKYSMRTTTKQFKGVRLQYLTHDGEIAMTSGIQVTLHTLCQGTGEVDAPDPDFDDITHKVRCGACEGGKVRTTIQVPRIEWEPSRKVQHTWTAHIEAQRAKEESDRKAAEAKNQMYAVAQELVKALGEVGINANDYTRYDSYRCTIGLTVGNARELMHLLSTIKKEEMA